MAVTNTPSTAPIAPTPASGRPVSDAATATSAARTTPAPAPVAAPPPPPPVPAPIGFSLSYDAAAGSLVLQAREPGSGFLIAQIPPSYAVRLFSASIGPIAPARGGKVNSAV